MTKENEKGSISIALIGDNNTVAGGSINNSGLSLSAKVKEMARKIGEEESVLQATKDKRNYTHDLILEKNKVGKPLFSCFLLFCSFLLVAELGTFLSEYSKFLFIVSAVTCLVIFFSIPLPFYMSQKKINKLVKQRAEYDEKIIKIENDIDDIKVRLIYLKKELEAEKAEEPAYA